MIATQARPLTLPEVTLRPLLRRYHQLAYPKLQLIEQDTADLLASLQEQFIGPAYERMQKN